MPTCHTPPTAPRHRRRSTGSPSSIWNVILECDRPDAGGCWQALGAFDELRVGRGPCRRFWRPGLEAGRRVLHLEVPDSRMSGAHACLLRHPYGWMLEDRQSTNGSRCNGGPFTQCMLQDRDCVQLGHTFFTYRRGDACANALEVYAATASTRADLFGLDTVSPHVALLLTRLLRVAPSSVPVLIRGETGTGKELLARAVHVLSRRPGSFMAVNCCAIPGTLIDAQLFGHVKGAFSGAVRDELGFVRAANMGTLFLDEIGDLPASSQTALLRVLQQGEVTTIATEASPSRKPTCRNTPLRRDQR